MRIKSNLSGSFSRNQFNDLHHITLLMLYFIPEVCLSTINRNTLEYPWNTMKKATLMNLVHITRSNRIIQTYLTVKLAFFLLSVCVGNVTLIWYILRQYNEKGRSLITFFTDNVSVRAYKVWCISIKMFCYKQQSSHSVSFSQLVLFRHSYTSPSAH